jgi:hypothetical protein
MQGKKVWISLGDLSRLHKFYTRAFWQLKKDDREEHFVRHPVR